MAALTTQTVTWTTGLQQVTYAGAAAGLSDDCEAPSYGAQIVLHVKNTNASSRTATITYPGTELYGAGMTDPAYTINATTGDTFIPIHPMAANSSGRVTITWSASAGVTVAVLKFTQQA